MPSKMKKNPYGDATGPLGFPMQSELAKQLEGFLKSVPSDLRSVCKSEVDGQIIDGYCRLFFANKEPEFHEDERAEVSYVTTRAIDRDFEVVLPGGMKWDQFRKNPVVPFGHNYKEVPVGKAMWVARKKSDVAEEDGWQAKTRYITKPKDWQGPWLPDAVWHTMKEAKIFGKSAGFIPLEGRPPNSDDMRKDPRMADVSLIISKAIVVEYSVVPVPANQASLSVAFAKTFKKGFAMPDTVMEDLGLVLPTEDADEELVIEFENETVKEPKTQPSQNSSTDFNSFCKNLTERLKNMDVNACVERGANRILGRA